jgi:acetamidase/formamidase
MGFSPDLKTATEMAVRNMIDFLVTEKHLSRDEAYMLTSGGCGHHAAGGRERGGARDLPEGDL